MAHTFLFVEDANKKNRMKALDECESCLYENNVVHGRAGSPALTANTWLSKRKKDKGRRKRLFFTIQSFSAWDLTKFPEFPFSFRTAISFH